MRLAEKHKEEEEEEHRQMQSVMHFTQIQLVYVPNFSLNWLF